MVNFLMWKNVNPTFFLLITTLLGTSSFTRVYSQILYVNSTVLDCGGALPCYNNLQEAVSDAAQGEEIRLQAGTYSALGAENVLTISKSLTISGESVEAVILDAADASHFGIWVGAPDVSLRNLTVQNAPKYGIINQTHSANRLTLENVQVRNCAKTGIAFRKIEDVTLKNLQLRENSGNGLSLASVANVVIENVETEGNTFQTVEGFTAAIGIFSTAEEGGSSNITLQGDIVIAEPVWVYLQPGPLDTANLLTNPPLPISQVSISMDAPAIVGVDVPIILNNPALPEENFGGVMGADALYYFGDMETASTCAEVAAREQDGILEPYIFLFDREAEERFYLPRVTLDPMDVSYDGTGTVEFQTEWDSRGPVLSANWYVSSDQGLSWEELREGGSYSGTTTNRLRIDPVSVKFHQNQYRFVGRNEWGRDTSAVAVLHLSAAVINCQVAPSITCPPSSVIEKQVWEQGNMERPTAISGCSGLIDTMYFQDRDLRLPGFETGKIVRTWYVSDELGNLDSCSQQIFLYSENNLPVSTNGDLTDAPIFSLFPNPASGLVKLEFHKALSAEYKLKVQNLLGENMLDEHMHFPQTRTISVENWIPGMYLVQLMGKDDVSCIQKLWVRP